MDRPDRAGLAFGLLAVAWPCAALADDSPPERTGEIVVYGRSIAQVGTADSGSQGSVGYADFEQRPLSRVGELAENVPGLIATQHSGEGKANQYFLRGFNLDHGTDLAGFVDGAPVNMRSHGHGQGYLDLNGLIPEVVEREDYRKGPYRADVGDFSLAGASYMTTVKKLNAPFMALEGGQYGWRRLAGGASTELGGGDLTFIGQWKTYDGPWQLPEKLEHESFWSKYAHDTPLGPLQLTLQGYHGKWHPTEQIPEREIGTADCGNAFCALDTSAVGETWRYVLSAGLKGDKWRASAYAQYYDWHMLSDSTYTQQINQLDRRSIIGGRYEYTLVENDKFTVRSGAEARYDDIGRVGLQHTVEGEFVSDVTKNAVKEGSISPYAEVTWSPIDKLRLLGGLREDFYSFDVHSKLSDTHGNRDDNLLSPKLGAAYTVNSNVELYANWGRGFHSNDARGVAVKLDADTPLLPGLVRGTGKEVGARYQQGNFSVTTTYWWLDLASELKFSGDANAAEPSNPSKRRGYEIVSFWRPMPWLAIDAVWTGSHARSVPDPTDPDQIGHVYMEGAIESAGELGISAVQKQWEASVRLRYLGPYPLTDDNAHRADGEAVVNLRGAWKSDNYTVYAELLNVFGGDGKDIVYWYEAYAPGVDPSVTESCGVSDNCRMSRAEEPRTLRFGIRYQF